jgi:hypothetical protein
MDWAGRTNPLAPLLPRYNPIGFFFFWGYVKDQVFRTKVGSVVKLSARINNAVASVTPQMLENTWCEIEYRLYILLATNSAHIETY